MNLFTHALQAHETLDKQIQKANETLKSNPSDTNELLYRARLHWEHKDYDKAFADLDRLEKIAPLSSKLHLLKARILTDLDRYEEASASLGKFFVAEPQSIDAHLLRSKISDYTGKGYQAIADARVAIKLAKKPPLSSYLQLIAMERKYGSEDSTAEAFALAKSAVGSIPSLLETQAEWLAESGNPEQASIIYTKIREKTPSLSFTIWLDEAYMWDKLAKKSYAYHARLQAKEAWKSLSPKIQQRKAMTEKYKSLLLSLKKP